MIGDQLRQERAVYSPRHIVPRRNGEKRPRIVVKTYSVVEARRLCHMLAKAHHSFWTIVKPPWRSQLQARIMSSQRCEFPTVGRFVQGKKNNGQVALIAEFIEQRAQRIHIIGRGWDVRTHIPAVALV